MDNSIFAYTAITGDRDQVRSDIPSFSENRFAIPVYGARMYKLLPHLFFPEYSIYIWVDGNVFLTKNLDHYVYNYLKDRDIVTFKHPDRTNIYQEAEAIKSLGKLKEHSILLSNLDSQVQFYKKSGFNENVLYETKVIIRRNSPHINCMFEAWWSHLCRWQYRDQVSLPFVLRHFPHCVVGAIEGSIVKNQDFICKPHIK